MRKKGRASALLSTFLSAFYDPPPLRTLLRTPVLVEVLTRRRLKTLLRSTFLKEPSKNLLELGSWFPFRESKIPPPENPEKLLKKLQFGPPRDSPEN